MISFSCPTSFTRLIPDGKLRSKLVAPLIFARELAAFRLRAGAVGMQGWRWLIQVLFLITCLSVNPLNAATVAQVVGWGDNSAG